MGEFLIHKLLQELILNDLIWAFDAVSLYPSAMSDPETNYRKIQTGNAFTPDMNIELVEKFNNQTFTQESAILKIKYYNPKNIIVQHLPVTERENKIEINRMRNGYFVDVLTSVDMQDIVKIGGKIIQIYEGVIYCEIFKVFPFKKVIDNLFELPRKYKDENKDVMQLLVRLFMNCLYGEQIRKGIEESYQCKSEKWMMTEYDERVSDYQRINFGNNIVKMRDDVGLEDEV